MTTPVNPFAPQPRTRVGEAPPPEPEGMSGTTKAILIALGVGGLFWVASKVWDASQEEKRLADKLDALESESGEHESGEHGAHAAPNPHPGVVIVMPPTGKG